MFRFLCVLGKDLHDLVWVRVGRRLEEHRVEQTEDGGVRADPEGEHGDGGDGEAAGLYQLAESEAKIVEHTRVMPLAWSLDSTSFAPDNFAHIQSFSFGQTSRRSCLRSRQR